MNVKEAQAIKAQWDRADKLKDDGEAKLGEANRLYWAVAFAIEQAHDNGTSYHVLKGETGRPIRTVSRFGQLAREYGSLAAHDDLPSFWEAERNIRHNLDEIRDNADMAGVTPRRFRETLRALKKPEIMADPEIKAALVEACTDPQVRSQVADAVERGKAKSQEQFDHKHGRGLGSKTDRQSRLRTFRQSMMSGRKEVANAQNAIKPILPLDDVEQEDCGNYVTRLGLELGATESIIRSKGTDAELEAMLKKGE